MYQLVMSTIHDRAEDAHKDSDGYVGHIADLGTALEAAVTYMRALSEAYGQQWTVVPSGTRTPLSVTMYLPDVEAVVCVEVQNPEPKTDATEVARLLVVNSRYVRSDNHGAGLIQSLR